MAKQIQYCKVVSFQLKFKKLKKKKSNGTPFSTRCRRETQIGKEN